MTRGHRLQRAGERILVAALLMCAIVMLVCGPQLLDTLDRLVGQ